MNLKAITRNRLALAGAGTEAATASAATPALQPQLKQICVQLGSQLRSAWKWVDQSYTRQRLSKRLKVAETVSLGEKRFVSILQVDGAQFLIAGTANSISLLATMEQSVEASADFADVLRQQSQHSYPGMGRE